MNISEMIKSIESYYGSSPCPTDFVQFWQKQNEQASAPQSVNMKPVDFKNSAANYYEIHFKGTDGTPLRARYICPVAEQKMPTVLMFHDYNRAVRGWHHMTRFAALGYAVAALENRERIYDITDGWRSGPEGLILAQLYTDALTLAHVVLGFNMTDSKRLITWGEGLGGGLAMVVASMLPESVAKCAALNPMPADFYKVWEQNNDVEFYSGIRTYFREQDPTHEQSEPFFNALGYVDSINFAPLLKCELHMGTGLMDEIAPPDTQYAIYNRANCKKQLLTYPKYAHERINYYENELLKFMNFLR